MCHGARASVWNRQGEAFERLVGDAPLVSPDVLTRLWHAHRTGLALGRSVTAGEVSLLALRVRLDVVGLLVVSGALPDDDLSRPYLERLCERLARLLRHGPAHSRLPLAVPLPAEQGTRSGPGVRLSRGTLLDLLRDARWNVSLVAHWLGISRQTVYTRLRFFDIARPKGRRRALPSNDTTPGDE